MQKKKKLHKFLFHIQQTFEENNAQKTSARLNFYGSIIINNNNNKALTPNHLTRFNPINNLILNLFLQII